MENMNSLVITLSGASHKADLVSLEKVALVSILHSKKPAISKDDKEQLRWGWEGKKEL